ncbi:MAG: 4Fe-4S dicluster domain-containing protein [Candidatus Cloacimonetes bacterium]|nr:4Fe-4S dicluster domain-containing protein [Candidatus Cloacimonadota bacterium]
MKPYSIYIDKWSQGLAKLLQKYDIYAPIKHENYLDYELLTPGSVSAVVYNQPKPSTPLKAFFFPVKENVVRETSKRTKVVIGAPSCDLQALKLLDRIFLEGEYLDTYYQKAREETIVIGTDCLDIQEHCHCTTYGIEPYPTENCDISLAIWDQKVMLQPLTAKGEQFINELDAHDLFHGEIDFTDLLQKRESVRQRLKIHNQNLPDNEKTREGVIKAEDAIWKKYAATCVSCGACAAICPTCHCFLLIDRQGFEKIKNWDTCQYPAFEKVAAGEDPLKKLYNRLANRYFCKFVYKPDMFGEIACTGCGRCIEACIGKINKNEIITEICQHL